MLDTTKLNKPTLEEEHLLSFYAVENDVSEDDEDDETTTNEDESSSSAPPGWKLERSTKATGRFFYFNVESRLKYWQDLSLPYGWAVEYSETDHKTYINMITGERTLKKPRNKNQISPDAHAKQRGRKMSRGGSFGSNNSAEKHRQRSGSGDASVNDWKLVFSEKFKQRYYFNPQTKKQFWRVENTPEGWAFEWKGKNKSYFNVYTGEKAKEPPELTTEEQEEQVEKEEGEIEDGEITEAVVHGGDSDVMRRTSRSSSRSDLDNAAVNADALRHHRGSPNNRRGQPPHPHHPPQDYSRSRSPLRQEGQNGRRGGAAAGHRRGYSRSRSRSPPRAPPFQAPSSSISSSSSPSFSSKRLPPPSAQTNYPHHPNHPSHPTTQPPQPTHPSNALPPPLPPPPPSQGQQPYYNDGYHHQPPAAGPPPQQQPLQPHYSQEQQYPPQNHRNAATNEFRSWHGQPQPPSNHYNSSTGHGNGQGNARQWAEDGGGSGNARNGAESHAEEGEIEIDYTRR